MATTFILTCEHAGIQIPKEYAKHFKGKDEELFSHKGMDFGALRLAKKLESELKLPLYFSSFSRLLVEANRSLDNEELFSEHVKKIPEKEKKQILETYYFPHRNEVESKIATEIAKGKKVIHFAIHTFTPAMDGEVRKAEIGILFDPKRPLEKTYANNLKELLSTINPQLKVIYNSPYPGTNDGFPTYLRKVFDKEMYAGFEIEVNQKFFLNGDPDVWESLVTEITEAFKKLVK